MISPEIYSFLMLGGILAVTLTLYVTQWLPIEITSLLILPALYFTGLLDLDQTFSCFSSSATVTIAAMYILSAGLVRTGVLDLVSSGLKRHAKASPKRFMLLLAVFVPLMSAVMNNTPVVVMMVPVVLGLSREMALKPSKMMIPLSFFAILGGTSTLIGTSTNILVDELYRNAGGPGFSMFEFTPLGLIFAAAGGGFILLFGRKLLPERTSLSSMLPRGRTAKFVTEIEVVPDSALCGEVLGEVLEAKPEIRLLELVRGEEVVLAPAARSFALEAGDILLIEGSSKDIARFVGDSKATLSTVVEDDRRVPMKAMELQLAEAVVLPDSPFLGQTVAQLALNRRFGVKVMAVQRRGRHHRYKIRQMLLKPGDVLLLQSDAQGFGALAETEAVLLVEGLERALRITHRAPLALAVMALVIGLAAWTSLPIAVLAVTGAALMLIGKCLRLDEAFRALDPQVLLLLAGTIPLGHALTETGMARVIVAWTIGLVGMEHPVILVSMLYLVTTIMTQFLSNNASAVLMTPIVLGIAAATQSDPKPFLMAVAFGASASFLSPIGYQTNTIVFGPGGYRFTDYLRVGVPLTLLMWGLASWLIPVFWPL